MSDANPFELTIPNDPGWQLQSQIDELHSLIEQNTTDIASLQKSAGASPTFEVKKIITVTYAQLQIAALTNNIEIYSMPGKWQYLRTVGVVGTLFAGAGGCRIGVGVAGDSNTLQRYLNAFDASTLYGTFLNTHDIPSFTASPTSIRVYAEADNLLSGLNAGVIQFELTMSRSIF